MQLTDNVLAQADSSSVGNRIAGAIRMNRNLCRIIPALLALTALSWTRAVAQAGTIVNVTSQAQDPNASLGSGKRVRSYNILNSPGGPHEAAVTAACLNEVGAFDFKVSRPPSAPCLGPGGSTSSSSILSFCIELTEYIQYGPTNLTMIPRADGQAQVIGPNVTGMGATSAMSIEELWGNYSSSVLNPPAGLTTSQAAGAFQLAVWKLEHVGKNPFGTSESMNFAKGYVDLSSRNASDATVLGKAGNWTNTLSLNPSSGELAQLVAIGGANYQGHVSQSVTPEPSSNLIWLALAAIGVYPIMYRRSKVA